MKDRNWGISIAHHIADACSPADLSGLSLQSTSRRQTREMCQQHMGPEVLRFPKPGLFPKCRQETGFGVDKWSVKAK